MTTTYLGQSVQDLTKIGSIDFTEHYPQFLPKKGVWEVWTYSSGSTHASSVYIWLDKDVLILVDNEQWANDLCAAGYKVRLKSALKPVLKPHTVTEWAFKMGTVCEAGTPAPDWGTLTLNKGHQWVATSLENSYQTEQTLSDYFNLGTHCKYGTPYNLVRSTADNGVILNTEPMPKRSAQRCVGIMALM